MKGQNKTALRISLIAIATAIVTVFTMMVRIPTAKGYLNLCDVAICFAAFTLGPWTALIAGGVGTALADFIGGYPQWALVSLIVHGIEGLLVALIAHNTQSLTRKVCASLVCILVVAGGYCLLSGLFLTGFATAVVEIPGNIAQAAVGAILGLIVSESVKKAYPPVKALSW